MRGHYIFSVVATRDVETGKRLSQADILLARQQEGLWPLGPRTPHQSKFVAGDAVIFYAAGPSAAAKHVLAVGELGGPTTRRSRETITDAWLGGSPATTACVPIRNVSWLEKPLPMRPLVPKLDFIKVKKYWGLFVKGGVIQIPEKDFCLIVSDQRLGRRI